MSIASGIPPDEVIVHRDEMASGEDPVFRSASASKAPAPPATHFIVHTRVKDTSDDVEISDTDAYVRLSDWMTPSHDATVQLSTHPGSHCPAQLWDHGLQH